MRGTLASRVDIQSLMSRPINLKALSGIINLNAETNSDNRVKVLGMVRAKATAFGPAIEYSKAIEYRLSQVFNYSGKFKERQPLASETSTTCGQ